MACVLTPHPKRGHSGVRLAQKPGGSHRGPRERFILWMDEIHFVPPKKHGKPLSHLLSGWPKKSSNFRFTTKMVFPKSLKFMDSESELFVGICRATILPGLLNGGAKCISSIRSMKPLKRSICASVGNPLPRCFPQQQAEGRTAWNASLKQEG